MPLYHLYSLLLPATSQVYDLHVFLYHKISESLFPFVQASLQDTFWTHKYIFFCMKIYEYMSITTEKYEKVISPLNYDLLSRIDVLYSLSLFLFPTTCWAASEKNTKVSVSPKQNQKQWCVFVMCLKIGNSISTCCSTSRFIFQQSKLFFISKDSRIFSRSWRTLSVLINCYILYCFTCLDCAYLFSLFFSSGNVSTWHVYFYVGKITKYQRTFWEQETNSGPQNC